LIKANALPLSQTPTNISREYGIFIQPEEHGSGAEYNQPTSPRARLIAQPAKFSSAIV